MSFNDLSHGSVFFVGTATVVIRYAGFTILTDPNFLHKGEHVRLGHGVRSRRVTEPAIDIDDLPDLDLVVLSHFHEDHFDRVAKHRLERALPIVTTPHAADRLARLGFGAVQALTTWQSLGYSKADTRLRVTAMPGRRGPRLLAALLPPVMGTMLEFETSAGARRLRLYITGDTLMHDRIHEIRARYADIDLALLHLGGTCVRGILVTMDGRQGVELMRAVNPHLSIPVHYDDYTVFKSPRSEFELEVAAAHLEPYVRYLQHGETYTFDVPERRRVRRSA